MKKLLTMITAILMMFMVFTACDGGLSNSSDKESEYLTMVKNTQVMLDEYADDIYRCWYDYVYEDEYWSVNAALAAAANLNKDNILIIESNNDAIKDLYKSVKEGKYQLEVKEVMQAYNDYYSFVMEVSGSFQSFSADKEKLKK